MKVVMAIGLNTKYNEKGNTIYMKIVTFGEKMNMMKKAM